MVGIFDRALGRQHSGIYNRSSQGTLSDSHWRSPKLEANGTTRIHPYGNYLNVTFIINDPAYLTEPYIREYSWVYAPDQVIPPFPCEMTPDGTIVQAGTVPNYLPGKNDVLYDFATEYGIPHESALGGAETTYPEYIKKMKTMKVAPRTTTEHFKRAG